MTMVDKIMLNAFGAENEFYWGNDWSLDAWRIEDTPTSALYVFDAESGCEHNERFNIARYRKDETGEIYPSYECETEEIEQGLTLRQVVEKYRW